MVFTISEYGPGGIYCNKCKKEIDKTEIFFINYAIKEGKNTVPLCRKCRKKT